MAISANLRENKRVSFAKIPPIMEMPDLLELQRRSYEDFLQADVEPEKRRCQGLQQVFSEAFPVKDFSGIASLEFVSYTQEEARYTITECCERGMTYAAPLTAKLKLIVKGKDGERIERGPHDVFMAELPLMTSRGTFIINGAERAIVSQLHRSPGVSYGRTKHVSGKELYSARFVPYKGAWLEFDINDIIYVRIDRRQKMLVTVFLRALGYSSDAQILSAFYDIEEIGATNFQSVLLGRIAAQDIIETGSGEVILPVNQKIDQEILDKIVAANIESVRALVIRDDTAISDTLSRDDIADQDEAVKEIYRLLRPGNPCVLKKARSFLKDLFYNLQRYDLGRVGRYKLNQRLGMAIPLDQRTLRPEDVVEVVRHLIGLRYGRGTVDDIDHLGNRRVKSVGELVQNQVNIGMMRMGKSIRERMSIQDLQPATPQNLVNFKPLSAAIKEFFGRSQLSQFMDQTNPLAELTHKRRLSALGPGGLTRERAGFEVRDIHFSHYGRICPIETPEGPNIGLITSLSTYARMNEFGFIETPYRKVKDGRATGEIEYLSAHQEDKYIVAQANAKLDETGSFIDKKVSTRFKDEFLEKPANEIDYMDVSPSQTMSVSTALIPFLEHDDANRALMGSNMQRQAVPLLQSEAPLVGTGIESKVARDSAAVITALRDGIVTEVSAQEIIIRTDEILDSRTGQIIEPLDIDTCHLDKFVRTNQNTCINQRSLVRVGQRVKAGQIIADGPATSDGELALGKNVLVAFMPLEGYNFEDAILISEKLVREGTFTSIHIKEFEVSALETKQGAEEITRDIPNISEEALHNLVEDGIVRVGARVETGDILVGKVTPKGETEFSPEERLLEAIFGEKAGEVRDASLRVPPGDEGIVIDVETFNRRRRDIGRERSDKVAGAVRILEEKAKREERAQIKRLDDIWDRRLTETDKAQLDLEESEVMAELKAITQSRIAQIQQKLDREVDRLTMGDELPLGVVKLVKVYVATKRKISVGDKISGRHGNKGVIARILPEEDMPFMLDGTPVEIVLNPLGVPSRMNVGQILETTLGWACKVLGLLVASPVFDGATEDEILEYLRKAGLPLSGKTQLFDGRTGRPFDQECTVGYIYMMKLAHLVDDKIHARSVGPYSLLTQQPLGGKAHFGGQRFGEMEVWALEAYGAAHTLQEVLTIKSDDVMGRTKAYESIAKGEEALQPGVPESFNVLVKELQSLGLNVTLEKTKGMGFFSAVGIGLASPEIIKSWSHGEVKKPETINYRTLGPEKDGLFCERIFGPTKDWECYCGKYKHIKHNGIVCERCGVEVTQSSVRRERLGHVELAASVSHIWFFKGVPSRMGSLLGMSTGDLEKVLYFENYIVIDPRKTPLQKKKLLTEDRYQKLVSQYGQGAFVAKMGAEAIRELLEDLDMDGLIGELRAQLAKASSAQIQHKVGKRLKLVEASRDSGNRPEWMILKVLPVLPPSLRPLVPLDGGRFAASDLNDLYRRVINRNNRLKKLQELRAPEVILRNEKRMLQEAVDTLFDNGRRGRIVKGPGNRPLKSLSDMLRGKQGRFRQNLLGKRVDYSGRSVIVVGPKLKFHQCGLPKKMALELFAPFIIEKMTERGYIHSIKSAKKLVTKGEREVWDILEEVVKEHPVLINRAPTLHRMGIQAFEPVLIEGKAIQIHPLVCTAFNADFDGDQMAVHVPLSIRAQMEARLLMLSPNNIFSTANSKPIAAQTQDIVLGCCYLTKEWGQAARVFASPGEVLIAHHAGVIGLHVKIRVRVEGRLINTTCGRVIFNEVLPKGLGFLNKEMDKKGLSDLVTSCYQRLGRSKTVKLLDALKDIGFEYATLGGISFSIDDMVIPPDKETFIQKARRRVENVEREYKRGVITSGERHNKVIDIWTHTTDRIADAMMEGMKGKGFNSIFLMADSGARGSRQQIRQLAGMRGLMAKPSGEIIELPIVSNFREGLNVLGYFISTHGARKGLADTALKTADAGYLTRRLVDVAQEVIVTQEDCGTVNGITIGPIREGDEIVETLAERSLGRVAAEDIVISGLENVILKANEEITEEIVQIIEEAGVDEVRIRSVLTCEVPYGVCRRCYGRDLSTGRMVNLGQAVGVIAAQSIGEPGTQLTLRTFHIGGTASRVVEEAAIKTRNEGRIEYHGLKTIEDEKGRVIVLNRTGWVSILNQRGREVKRHSIPYGAQMKVSDGSRVQKGKVIAKWDPYTASLFTEVGGKVRFYDILENLTMREEKDESTGSIERVIIEHGREELYPQIGVVSPAREVLYSTPVGAHIVVNEGDDVSAGDVLIKTPREIIKTKDITGGLPRVAELFEARRPKTPAVITEIDGVIRFGETSKGMRRVIVRGESDRRVYSIPVGKHLTVHEGDRVRAGDRLMSGPVVPHDILRVKGDRELQAYLVNEIQAVYKLQGVQINDKHVEVIVRQMLRKGRVEDPGDTKFLIGEQVDRFEFLKENERVKAKGGKPATATPVLQGVTKASLSTDSFISAASFQETTRVLTEASANGSRDELRGLKENIIIGHLVPAGTGLPCYQDVSPVMVEPPNGVDVKKRGA